MIEKPKSPRIDPEQPAPLDGIQFAALFKQAYPYLWQIAFGMSGDRSLADDLVQESAMIAWSKIETFQAGTNFAAWMVAIIRRCSSNLLRKQKLRATYATDPMVIDASEFTTQAKSTPVQIFTDDGNIRDVQTEFDDNVLHGLKSLGGDARCCLLLRVIQQLSYAEISQLMNMSQGTAMSHVHRSKAALRRFLERSQLDEQDKER